MFLSKPIIYLNALFISILENKQIYIYTKKIWDGIIDHVSTVSHRCKLFFEVGHRHKLYNPLPSFWGVSYIHCTLLFNMQLHIVLKGRLHKWIIHEDLLT